MNSSNTKGFDFLLDPMEFKTIPCQRTCPLHVDISSFLYLMARDRFDEAIEIIRKTNPFPSICGRICPHNCEMGCTRTHVDKPVSICKAERAAADHGRFINRAKESHNTGKKIAVIGSGPCGLTAALDLARTGYRVTVFEKAHVPGGSIRLGIAPFRMPHNSVEKEIQYIVNMGVKIMPNTCIGKDITFEELKRDHDSVFIASGAYYGGDLNLPNDNIDGIIDGIAFMNKVNTQKSSNIGNKKVTVIGGGYIAVDTARTAIRLGAKNVSIIFSRPRKDMDYPEAELKAAEEEGVNFYLLSMPTKINSDSNNRVSGLECVKTEMTGKDEFGKKAPVAVKDSKFTIDADIIVNALDKTPDTTFLPENLEFKFSKTGLLSANPKTLATSVPGIFIGGNYLNPTRDIVNSIADGHKAALSIDEYLRKEEEAPKSPDVGIYNVELPLMQDNYETIQRRSVPIQDCGERITNLREVEIGLSADEAVKEAQRCLQCNNMWDIDEEICIQCGQCVQACPRECLSMAELNEEQTDQFFYEGLDLKENKLSPISVTLKRCMRCGVCVEICPADAISFRTCEPTNIKVLA